MKTSSPFASLRFIHHVRHLLLTLICIGSFALSPYVFDAATAAVESQADLTVTKSGDETATLGGTVTYNINVVNGGPDDATGVTLTDPIPAHTTFVRAASDRGEVTFANNTLTVRFGTLPAFEGGNVTLVVSVNGDAPRGTVIGNTARVSSDTPDPEESNNSATFFTTVTGPFPGDLLISEFRFRGPGGANDEYVELYNNTDAPIIVSAPDGSDGWALAASDGVVRFVLANGTNIPARGHYLGVNSGGYSLNGYPSGATGGATGDGTYTNDIHDNSGIALFNTSNPANFNMAHRFDAVGFNSVTNTAYREGGGLGVPVTADIEHAFIRNLKSGTPQDTDNNTADFLIVAGGGNAAQAGAQLGAPGPENTQSPTQRNGQIPLRLIEPESAAGVPPNRVRSGSGNSGTLSIRRRVTNETNEIVTRLRFRVIDVTTMGTPVAVAPQAILRLVTSGDFAVTTSLGTLTVQGTILEQPPSQPAGGGLNTSVTVALPNEGLLPDATVDVQFLLNIEQAGYFRFYVNVEALTAAPAGEEDTLTPLNQLNRMQAGRPTASK